MGLIRKVVPGVLAVWIALRPPQEAREAAEPVHSRAPEPPHNHPELHEPAYAIPSEAGILGGGSENTPMVPVGWEEAADVAVRARYDYQRNRSYLASSSFSPVLVNSAN
jgi:hypothetical protein